MDGNDNNDDKIYIPYGIKIEKEIFSGFGKKELKHLIISVLITVIISVILFLITDNPVITVVAAVTGIGGGYTMSMRQPYSQSMIEILKSIITYYRTQQKFEYIYKNTIIKHLGQDNGTSSPVSENKESGGENAEHSDNASGCADGGSGGEAC